MLVVSSFYRTLATQAHGREARTFRLPNVHSRESTVYASVPCVLLTTEPYRGPSSPTDSTCPDRCCPVFGVFPRKAQRQERHAVAPSYAAVGGALAAWATGGGCWLPSVAV